MKKLMTIVGLTVFTLAANAQESERGMYSGRDAKRYRAMGAERGEMEAFKPHAGNVTSELGIAGGLGNTALNLNNNAGMLRFRYFVKDDLAIRLGANIANESSKTFAYGTGSEEGFVKTRNTTVLFNIGVEKHFAGTRRLSPYVAADFIVGNTSNHSNGENATSGITYLNNYTFESKNLNNTTLGFRAVVGADYYIAKNVYLGVEAGLGYSSTKFGETETTQTLNNVTTTVTSKSTGKESAFTPGIVTGVRLGFAF
ncbi:hypothetical protein DBR32_02480 [Taibaiella sp. KBW10]|uniref:hypothetical protein n=1 Tax=Taibaiella sp. KBW10 TaxID=2153357 RepID=UPI000F5A22B7|nr:hypothetical protein [Taibaiella sp. KBW10]RQO32488.1 hypothetical protein DBR32_02480 [Taibaiella sp. KBW10]